MGPSLRTREAGFPGGDHGTVTKWTPRPVPTAAPAPRGLRPLPREPEQLGVVERARPDGAGVDRHAERASRRRGLLGDRGPCGVDLDDAVALAVGDPQVLAVGGDVARLPADLHATGDLVGRAVDPPGAAVGGGRDPDVAA